MALSRTASIKFILFVAVVACCVPLAGCIEANRTTIVSNPPAVAANAIDINRASAAELTSLPGIGDAIAARIVDFREKNGPFHRPEELLLVQGISERKFREIRAFVKTEPSLHEQ